MHQERDERRKNRGARGERAEGESCGRGNWLRSRTPPPTGAPEFPRHRPQRHDDQGDVEEQPEQALLGRDRHRLGVGDRDGGVLVLTVLAVGGLEGAGAVALEGAFGEEVEAAGDEVGTAAGVDVDAARS